MAGVAGAVYNPEEVMLPPDTTQVTAVLLFPVTIAVNCTVPPGSTVAEGGVRVTVIFCVDVTVTLQLADFDPLVTVTVSGPAAAYFVTKLDPLPLAGEPFGAA